MSSAIEARPLAGDRASKGKISHVAGKPAPKEMLVDLVRLEREYFVRRPDLSCPNQMVSFGTSGHRGSSLDGTFTEAHEIWLSRKPFAITGIGKVPTVLVQAEKNAISCQDIPRPGKGLVL